MVRSTIFDTANADENQKAEFFILETSSSHHVDFFVYTLLSQKQRAAISKHSTLREKYLYQVCKSGSHYKVKRTTEH